MLPKHILEEVLWVINDPAIWASFETLIQHRIETIRIANDNANHDEFLKNQGAIKELKELMNTQKRTVFEHAKGGVMTHAAKK